MAVLLSTFHVHASFHKSFPSSLLVDLLNTGAHAGELFNYMRLRQRLHQHTDPF